MSFLTGLIFGLFITPAQFAPADVPKNHWAYGAVNELFANGLLKGYPEGKALTLANVPMDMVKAKERQIRWDKEKLSTRYETSPPLVGWRRDPSNWELAVGVHRVCDLLRRGYDPKERPSREIIAKELPEIADSVSMFQSELKQLGLDPKKMVADLDYFRRFGVTKLELDEERSYDRTRILSLLKRWYGKKMLEKYIDAFQQSRSGFTFDESTAWEQTILVYGAWDYVFEHPAEAKEEIPDLTEAISRTREYLVKLGGSPGDMILRLNQLQAQPVLRFNG